MNLDGGDASQDTGYGGRPVLNPWRGRSSQKLSGFGPGGPAPAGNWGVGANYNYGNDQISDLLLGVVVLVDNIFKDQVLVVDYPSRPMAIYLLEKA